MQFEKWTTLDLDKARAAQLDLGTLLFEGDTDPVKIGVKLTRGGEPVTAGSASGWAVLADGTTSTPFANGHDGNEAWIIVPQGALAVPGKIEIFLRVSDTVSGNTTAAVTVYAFGYVKRTVTDTQVNPGTPIPSVAELNQAAADCIAATASAEGVLSNLSYETGHKILAWVDGYFIRTSNNTINTTPVSNASYQYVLESCRPGDVFYIKATMAGSSQRTWVFIDEDNYFITRSAAAAAVDGYVTAPANAVKLVVNNAVATPGEVRYIGLSERMDASDGRMDEHFEPSVTENQFVQASIARSTGEVTGDTKRVSDGAARYALEDTIVRADDGYKYNVNYYTAADEFISANVMRTAPMVIPAGSYYRLQLMNSEDTAATVAQLFSHVHLTRAVTDTPFAGIVWDWWYTEGATDARGNAYIGFVDEDALMGVAMIRPDGHVRYRYLSNAANDDDHNPFGVAVLSDGRLIAMGTLGHSASNQIKIFIADKAGTVDCTFTDKSVELAEPSGLSYKTCYAQVFVHGETVTDFFRVVIGSSNLYAAVQSTDNGGTWKLYTVTNYGDPYIKFSDRGSGIVDMVCTKNPINANRTMNHGYVDVVNHVFYTPDGTQVGTMDEVVGGIGGTPSALDTLTTFDAKTSFPEIITGTERIRLLDAKRIGSTLHVLWAEADSGRLDWTYYHYSGGENTALGKSGLPYYKYSGYIGGCCFIQGGMVAVACLDSADSDGEHEVRVYDMSNGQTGRFGTDKLVCRPIWLGNGRVALCNGEYNDTSTTSETGSFTGWTLSMLVRNV